MSLDHCLMQKQRGETSLQTYVLIMPARNEAAFIEQTILFVIYQTVQPVSEEFIHFRRKEQMCWMMDYFKKFGITKIKSQ